MYSTQPKSQISSISLLSVAPKLCAISTALSFSLGSSAASVVGSASVEILPALNVEETSAINFGQLQQVDGTCIMDHAGQLSGPDGMNCNGTESLGAFIIAGADGATVNISVTGGAITGIGFNPIIVGSSSRTLVNGSQSVAIAGELTLENAPLGIQTISYTFTANYE